MSNQMQFKNMVCCVLDDTSILLLKWLVETKATETCSLETFKRVRCLCGTKDCGGDLFQTYYVDTDWLVIKINLEFTSGQNSYQQVEQLRGAVVSNLALLIHDGVNIHSLLITSARDSFVKNILLAPTCYNLCK